jgi:hypothetical protein
MTDTKKYDAVGKKDPAAPTGQNQLPTAVIEAGAQHTSILNRLTGASPTWVLPPVDEKIGQTPSP